MEPRWRKMLSIKDAPWIADHVVNGTILLPASVMMVMALEAVKQSVPEHQKLEGFLIKKATFASPIFIDPEKKVEVVTQLRTIQHDYEKTSLRFEVMVLSVDDDGKWNQCLKAVIHAKVKQDVITEVDGGSEARTAEQSLFQSYEEARRCCTRALSKEDFYDGLKEQGTLYGVAFALAQDLWDGHDLCLARVDVSQSQEAYEGVVHPAILDSCFQLCFIPPSEGMTKELEFPTFTPHRLRDAWISATGWQYPQTSSLRTRAEARINTSSTGITCSFAPFADGGSLLCHTKHAFSTAVATNMGSKGSGHNQLLQSIDWRPQLSLLTKAQLSDYCNANTFLEDEAAVAEYCARFEDSLRLYLERMLPQLQEAVAPKTPAHLHATPDRTASQRQSCRLPRIRLYGHLHGVLRRGAHAIRRPRPAHDVPGAHSLAWSPAAATSSWRATFTTPALSLPPWSKHRKPWKRRSPQAGSSWSLANMMRIRDEWRPLWQLERFNYIVQWFLRCLR
ncbi:hypothetical protein PG991_000013 [Apiospora marii]|uniref:PKS/mFAS DH domain-containing protein n=1 Tax=Apiospora marii TaxID=335849 RepID=A0ABR1T0W7_9PEZI